MYGPSPVSIHLVPRDDVNCKSLRVWAQSHAGGLCEFLHHASHNNWIPATLNVHISLCLSVVFSLNSHLSFLFRYFWFMPSWTNTSQKERKPREEPRLQIDLILTICPSMVTSPAVGTDKSFNAVTFPFASWVIYGIHRNRLPQGSSLDSTDLDATTTEQLSLRQGLIQGGEWKRTAHASPCVSNCDLLSALHLIMRDVVIQV